ncbi:DUF485 domain-containing protein [Aneurinibacillus migulanus]|uniref:DUF485 domain-containing protein n=1 Tax=Aneurinibacillus migulanus TaxID=47500 RepID=UPI0006A0C373|nr:DUF485 domain-containing protein [Aneurinibacillus migulanus]MCP1356502.1 DUF485 domain-containing protein [Aneurinibacillus migulanus]CEH27869.1 Uncharacterized protein BN1090_A2_00285 [Aneurinibacillus migulanus]
MEIMKNEKYDKPLEKKQGSLYTTLIQTGDFQELIQKKKEFIIPMSIFFFVFYFTLPILAAYTDILTKQAMGHITWAWVYALMQFVLVWVCGYVYVKKSEKFDISAKEILSAYEGELDK